MKYFFRNLPYFIQLVLLLLCCSILHICLSYKIFPNSDIPSVVILPIFIAIFTGLFKKIVESNKMYADLKLYNYNQIKKLPDIEKHQKQLFKIFTDNNKNEKDSLFIEIENTGTILISTIEIIINRKNPTNDNYYFVNSPLSPGQKEYLAINYNINSIDDILLITYLNNTDKMHYFNSITHTNNFIYFKDHHNKKTKIYSQKNFC